MVLHFIRCSYFLFCSPVILTRASIRRCFPFQIQRIHFIVVKINWLYINGVYFSELSNWTSSFAVQCTATANFWVVSIWINLSKTKEQNNENIMEKIKRFHCNVIWIIFPSKTDKFLKIWYWISNFHVVHIFRRAKRRWKCSICS